MQGDHAVLRLIENAFGRLERPAHFTDILHCAECAEHDDRLQLCNPRSLGLEDVGYVAFDPFCVATPHALAYFFPALARLALNPPSRDHGWYASQLLFHLDIEKVDNRFYRYCDETQRRAVARLLAHIMETRLGLAFEDQSNERFMQCHQLWSAQRIEGHLLN